jgi:hypothetical protein
MAERGTLPPSLRTLRADLANLELPPPEPPLPPASEPKAGTA